MDERTDRPDVGTRRAEAKQPPQAEKKHPDEWERDLNPDRLEGQNVGASGGDLPSAHDFKDLRQRLDDLSPEELREISIAPPGSRLRQGATYMDLAKSDRSEFTATGERTAGEDERLAPKDEVSYPLWNRLRGIDDPERAT